MTPGGRAFVRGCISAPDARSVPPPPARALPRRFNDKGPCAASPPPTARPQVSSPSTVESPIARSWPATTDSCLNACRRQAGAAQGG